MESVAKTKVELKRAASKSLNVEVKTLSGAIKMFLEFAKTQEFNEYSMFISGTVVSKYDINPKKVLEVQRYHIYEGEVFVGAGKKSKGSIVPKVQWTMNDIFQAWDKICTNSYKVEIVQSNECENYSILQEQRKEASKRKVEQAKAKCEKQAKKQSDAAEQERRAEEKKEKRRIARNS